MSKAFDFAKCIEGSGNFDGFMVPSSTSSAAGVAGEIRNNNGVIERWSATDFAPQWRPIDEDAVTSPAINYLVIGGGGAGGGFGQAGGGGAGGYRTSWGTGNVSGGLTAVETNISVTLGNAYTITVGAGGDGVAGSVGNKGGDSVFATITSEGGGPGAPHGRNVADNLSGGSSGGTGTSNTGSFTQNTNKWFSGGQGQGTTGSPSGYGNYYNAGGGGGAGGAGGDGISNDSDASVGGVGLASDITGSSIFRAGGGAGGHGYPSSNGYPYSPGGNGGGGDAQQGNGNNGTDGKGAGGAGASTYASTLKGGDGGNGVIILRGPSSLIATFSAGVTVNGTTTSGSQAVTGTTVGTDRYWEITAASSDTVTFSTS